MTEEQFNILDQLVIAPLKENGCQVYVFGSRASSKYHSHSDVDLLYFPTIPLPIGFISGLKEAIEESRFPFRVDLVNESELAAS
jgi:predicted nucleotidyltransferase